MADSRHNSDWIEDGEKFALIGMRLYTDRQLGRLELPGGVTVLPDAAFALPDHWREWLGNIRAENAEECNLFLLAKMLSESPGVRDGENEILTRRVGDFFMGLVLSSKFTAYDEPFQATGGRVSGAIDVRGFGELAQPWGLIVEDRGPIGELQFQEAAKIAERLQAFNGPWQQEHWRFFRCLEIYQTVRNNRDMLDRIHQFTRCIEGLIASRKGDTTRQFKSRTELFVGPSHHELMGTLYEVRSDIEHLHEYKHLAARDRPTRIRFAQLEAVSEWVARSCLVRILLDPALLTHFGSVAALEQFWAKSPEERRAIWGTPIDPMKPLDGFNFDYVSDADLGVGPFGLP